MPSSDINTFGVATLRNVYYSNARKLMNWVFGDKGEEATIPRQALRPAFDYSFDIPSWAPALPHATQHAPVRTTTRASWENRGPTGVTRATSAIQEALWAFAK